MRLHYNHLFVAHNNVALTPKFHFIDAVPRLSLFHQVKLNFEIQLPAKNIQNDKIGSYKCQNFSFNINIAQFDSKLGTSNNRKISFHSCYVIQKLSKLPAAIYNFQKKLQLIYLFVESKHAILNYNFLPKIFRMTRLAATNVKFSLLISIYRNFGPN